jgi:hypothetical protein
MFGCFPLRSSMRALSDDEDFFVRLREAVEWTIDHARLAEPKTSLRSHHLSPQLLAANRAAEVHVVCSFRRTSLGRRLIQQATHKASELRCGRLAVFYPDAQLADGAAEAETGGFFDIHNTPPWDTWVGLFRADQRQGGFESGFETYLVAYIPEVFVALAGRGIDVCPDGSLMWLADVDTPLTRTLRSLGWERW